MDPSNPPYLDRAVPSNSEKHVSFDPELQYHEIHDLRSKQRKRQVTRRVHILALLSLLFASLFYMHAWPLSSHHRHHENMSTPTEIPCAGEEHHQAPSAGSANHKTATISFSDASQFSLEEVLDNQGYALLSISGTITLTSASQPAAIVANISMTSHNIEIASTNFDTTDSSLTIGNPELENRAYLFRPRIELDVILSIRSGLKLEALSVSTRHLGIAIDPSLALTVSERTTLGAVSGSIKSPTCPARFASREKYISTVSGGIHGSYSLEDVLSVSTTSGGVRVGVVPKEAGATVRPAIFSSQSASGHQDVQFDTAEAPDREYRVSMDGGSGGISGTVIHGAVTSIRSASGSKSVSVVPYAGKGSSELLTEGGSGGSEVRVLSPLDGSKSLGALTSSHRSVSGRLSLTYPREWLGSFEGSSVSGHLSAEGMGLEVEIGGSPGVKKISGKTKVEGMAEMRFSSVSGGARLLVL